MYLFARLIAKLTGKVRFDWGGMQKFVEKKFWLGSVNYAILDGYQITRKKREANGRIHQNKPKYYHVSQWAFSEKQKRVRTNDWKYQSWAYNTDHCLREQQARTAKNCWSSNILAENENYWSESLTRKVSREHGNWSDQKNWRNIKSIPIKINRAWRYSHLIKRKHHKLPGGHYETRWIKHSAGSIKRETFFWSEWKGY